MLPEGLLQRMQRAVGRGEALDRHELGAVGLHRQHQARAGGFAIEQDRAGAADAVFASNMCAGEPEVVADEIDQQLARLGEALARRAVDLEADFLWLGHLIVPPGLQSRSGESAAGQNAGQMAAIVGRGMQIAGRIDQLGRARGGLRDRFFTNSLPFKNFLHGTELERSAADARRSDLRARAAPVIDREHRRESRRSRNRRDAG